ncbi:Nitrilotriacetate monooxygenase component A/pristinamycin IIA synthase subunit A [Penicillium manginii]|uniref:Nitrilotriacetate monooxygenase component A/pristinamycin IIA synthase subunit A n=1 Tax=Penicillium manginii TaxID=203109 RepID=UPI00254667DA|nr:Nitrilotriacetate monooxygenase component A/pristinamycin IIA synthase subunit A [Penicillium manginii]KAJ5744162.1 Nitrilotriacetate monooxygenase component A/pristinamycin IIA synthase subunit A [Penicillium manginii]
MSSVFPLQLPVKTKPSSAHTDIIILGGYDVYKGPRNLDPAVVSGAQWPVNEPLAVVPAMAAATKNIGFGVTVTTTYEQPYHLARRLSTVDHLTKGRLGWNHDDRYAVAEEYVKVTYKLWESSWRQDAVVRDRERGVYTETDRVRQINHSGKYFNVPGPHLTQPSPQRTPVILQAGTSKAGKTFAAQHAEAIFVAGHSPSVVAKNVAEIRQLAQSEFGRDPQSIKFLALLCLSAVEGWSKATPEVAKWTKATVGEHITVGGLGATPVGTPQQVADNMEKWVKEADVDGFNLAYAIKPGSFKDIIDLLIPELRKRGLFWDEYAVQKGTYRENLYSRPGQSGPPADHPAARYRWQAGVDAADHPVPEN